MINLQKILKNKNHKGKIPLNLRTPSISQNKLNFDNNLQIVRSLMSSQSTLEEIGRNFRSLLLAAVLYPLERIQSIQQVQSSYSNPSIKNSKTIISEAIHFGMRSYFRGFVPFISKTALVTTCVRIGDHATWDKNKSIGPSNILSVGLGILGYLLFYPLEIINMRMSVEVQQLRFYTNVRECVSKIKKNEGVKTLYRGFLYSCALFTAQLISIQQIRSYLEIQKTPLTEWQKAGLLVSAIGLSELVFYPLTTLKKLFQSNGAIGHSDEFYSIVRSARASRFIDLFRGFSTRLSNVVLYATIYSLWFADDLL